MEWRGGVARIHADGSLDTSFTTGAGIELGGLAVPSVNAIALQPDGKVLIAGSFDSYNGVARGGIARLFPNGELDTTFIPGTGANNHTWSVAVQPDGRILIAGEFTQYDGINRNRIARLNTDGSLDGSFDPGTGSNGHLRRLVLLADGRILVAGGFTHFDGVASGNIVRLETDGSLDITFHSELGAGVAGAVMDIAVQPDGRIIAVGLFHKRVLRLCPDGGLDPFFDPEEGADDYLFTTAIQPDGKILVGGSLGAYNGETRNGLARLMPDGGLDTGFDPGSGIGSGATAYMILLQADGRILLGGGFTSYDGVARWGIAGVQGGTMQADNHLRLGMRVFLGGPFDPVQQRMSDGIRSLGLLPTNEPYTALGMPLPESDEASIPEAVIGGLCDGRLPVDWVQIRISTSEDPGTTIAGRHALVLEDGWIVGTDGRPGVALAGLPPGLYHVMILHRNHLACMTADPVELSTTLASVDFTDPGVATWGIDARMNVNGIKVLWAGDVNGDGVIRYTGGDNDRDPILVRVGGLVPTSTVSGYFEEDVNMDGTVKYTGQNNDRDPILPNIGGVVPTNTRIQQLP